MFKILTMTYDPATRSFNEEILEHFCLNKQVKNCKAEFFTYEGRPCWTVFIEYELVLESDADTGDAGMDEAEQLLFERLRQWRREQADKEGVPTYVVATNREIKDIIKQAPRSLEALKAIRGFGRKKIEKYGAAVIGLLGAFYERQ